MAPWIELLQVWEHRCASAFGDIIADKVQRKAVTVTYGVDLCGSEVGLLADGMLKGR
jgi:hypothetical protein